MKSHRAIIGCVLAALLLAGSLTAPARGGTASHSGSTSTDALLTWNEITLTTLVSLPGTAGGAPAAAPIHVAMVQGAVFDAVNAIAPRRYEPYLLKRRFSAHASKDAAVATAAHAVLADIVSTVPNIEDPARATLLASLATQYEDFLAEIPTGSSKRKGVAAGNAAADAMIDAREDDGRFGPSQWVPNRAPGHWWPLTDPTTGQPVLDPTPWVGGVTPFLLESPSQFRTPGPKRLTSSAWARQFNQVKALGEAESTARSPEQTYIARWWQSQPLVSWNSVARQLVAREGLGLAAAARLFAMQNLSTADASINCWDDKYHYDFWRPWNAIPRAGQDGNPATERQADWTALITAPYPEHPSGHLCIDGAMVRVLRAFFGNRIEDGYEITSASAFLLPTDERTRRFTSFSEPLKEIIEARIWAGLHYLAADRQAKALGRNVADYAVDHFFQPLGHTP
jgi:hypothetical protein